MAGAPAGAGIASFRLRRIFPCLSISNTFTWIWSPSPDFIGHRLHPVMSQLRDVYQSIRAGKNLDKAPKSMIFLTVP